MSTNDGGPAFPTESVIVDKVDLENSGDIIVMGEPGMSLRQFYAGLAMHALLASTGQDTQSIAAMQLSVEQGVPVEQVVSERARDYADALLVTMEKQDV